MCRLFGLISPIEKKVEYYMLYARNNFKKQSERHPHGFGFGWYENGAPKIKKSGEKALESDLFDKLAKEVSSQIIIAHIRDASDGAIKEENSHPFSYENFIFAHNGTLHKKDKIFDMLEYPYNKDFTSDGIDSEIYFRFLVQNIKNEKDVILGLQKGIRKIIYLNIGSANFLLSDGERLYAFKYGRSLFYSLMEDCLIVSSEIIGEDKNRWKKFEEGLLLVVDKSLELREIKI
ncbi:MAG: class II glutamine amidotransferase [Dictyoglomus thermophilum]|uniref:Class II glutamine amidotransferase n=2 Tax=Pseudomonadati TaxID=3379134 RepID=A0A7C4NUW1_9BACT|nr:class II glutamine amidotransferase [Dictyoglomus thermophilum]MCX7720028.1 class II glutamine amidotransferase [Dictyoglomus thermophilum]TYT23467.1 class II glutamine amidotransferase [Dictyoglomus thermophilum]